MVTPELEARWIECIRECTGPLPGTRFPVPNGDDALGWRPAPGRVVALTVDVQVEGTHFRREWLGFEDLGRRAIAASVSDLAAMAARPRFCLVSLLSQDLSEREFRALARGLAAEALRYGAPIAGGNLSAGPLSISVTAVGESTARGLATRGGVREGDEIWVTGAPGLARLGYLSLAGEVELSARQRAAPLRAFRRPAARVEEALYLARYWPLRALVDLSDGLGRDLGHLTGGVRGVELSAEALGELPRLPSLLARCGLDLAEHVAKGGEDYELCLAASPRGGSRRAAARFRERFGLELTRIGRVGRQPGLWLDRSGKLSPLEFVGHAHDLGGSG